MNTRPAGKVYIVGAGPGDPGLLTLRAKECLAECDVVLYDTLVHPAILDWAGEAEWVFAGKRDSRHSLAQSDINRILVSYAAAGRCVVRLKGGDPFVFGRGAEEAAALRAAGIPFEVVPGVTAGIGAAAYAGIPVTHRGTASSVTFVSGHPSDDGTVAPGIPEMPRQGTLVFYMAVKNLVVIMESLLRAGHAPGRPAAVVEWGTYPRQRTIAATLGALVPLVAEAHIESPAILVVGEVVALREQLAWFESRPLSGLRVVLTHTPDPQGALESGLRRLGAEVLVFPTIAITGVPSQNHEYDQGGSFPDPGVFDWIVFTSVNAAEAVFHELERLGLDARHLAPTRLCATARVATEAIQRRFLNVDAQPAEHGTAAVLAALRTHPNRPLGPGTRIFLPRADIAPSELPQALRDAGATVFEHVAYRTESPKKSGTDIQAMLAFRPHLVLFTSPVAVRNFAALNPVRNNIHTANWTYGAIGPVTSDALRTEGLKVGLEPRRGEIPDLLDTVCLWFAEARNSGSILR